jgi:hypothetical protein
MDKSVSIQGSNTRTQSLIPNACILSVLRGFYDCSHSCLPLNLFESSEVISCPLFVCCSLRFTDFQSTLCLWRWQESHSLEDIIMMSKLGEAIIEREWEVPLSTLYYHHHRSSRVVSKPKTHTMMGKTYTHIQSLGNSWVNLKCKFQLFLQLESGLSFSIEENSINIFFSKHYDASCWSVKLNLAGLLSRTHGEVDLGNDVLVR